MSDFFEIDFLNVETTKSGDAIAVRYRANGAVFIHVVDGGYLDTGTSLVNHIRSNYVAAHVDHVVATHPDGDHAAGLRKVLEELSVGALWMHRPWLYVSELLPRFARFTSEAGLTARLRELYPNIAALEVLAQDTGVPIFEAFQGAQIGAFTVMAPTKDTYLDLVVASDKTPDATNALMADGRSIFAQAMGAVVNMVKSAWGDEVFSSGETSAENAMSIVQYANLSGEKILLTGDTGRAGLDEAADYAPFIGLSLPGINRFQVPHHGSRRNVSTETLDRWLGPRLADKSIWGGSFHAYISAAKEDTHHPRKAVVRAAIHRGAEVFTSENGAVQARSPNAPNRGWGTAVPLDYPEDQED
jgi:beta-lactamase superfamily II metal-dependent hydrolase